MAELAVQKLSNSGTAPTFSAAAASFTASVGSGSNTFLVVKNGSGATVTVGIDVPGATSYGADNPPVALPVPASGEKWLPMRKAYQGQDTPGLAAVTVSTATSVTVALVRMS